VTSPSPPADGRAARLLAAELRPEARSMAGIVGVLALSLGARLALPLLLGRFADDALEGAATSRLTALALV